MLISALHLNQSMLNKRTGVFYLSLKHESQLQSQTKIVGTLDQTLFFSFSCSPCPSQICLSRFSHQTLYTNIEGTRRHKRIPTILTETVVLNNFEKRISSVLHLLVLTRSYNNWSLLRIHASSDLRWWDLFRLQVFSEFSLKVLECKRKP